MRTTSTIDTGILALLLAGACGPAARQPAGDDTTSEPDAQVVAARTCSKMDILFVVDDSASMDLEQTNLTQNFPTFAQVLNDYMVGPGQLLDYRVAVTTTGRTITTIVSGGGISIPETETGDDGTFRNNCGPSRRWLERTDGNVVSDFECRAKVGTGGPSTEMPMLTSMLGLRERITDGTNAGFLRDDALLAIVYLTDEDDCSRTDDNIPISVSQDICAASAPLVPPGDLVTFLDTLKGGRGRWATAVIAGPTNCDSTFGSAHEARRLKEFVSQANMNASQNAVFSSICSGNLAGALTDALDTFTAACEGFPPIE